MIPLPWSPSSLGDFVNCPRQYHAKRVAKTHTSAPTAQMLWGTRVHLAFEERMRDGKPLPDDLGEHEPFMLQLVVTPGYHYTERKMGLTITMEPCDFNAPDVWHRGIVDHTVVSGSEALVTDYKTGKPHNKFEQLKANALCIFHTHPQVDTVKVRYYWTTSRTTTDRTYKRADVPGLWRGFMPDLKQYKEAFQKDIWQPRPSGLCPWCPVSSCEYWKPRS